MVLAIIWKRIHYYENPAFEQEGISRAGKIWSTITIRINYLAEMCFCFHLIFQLLKFFIRNSKKQHNFKSIFPVPYTLSAMFPIFSYFFYSSLSSFYNMKNKIEFVLLDERWISKFKKCLLCKMKIFIQFKLLHWLDSNKKKENRMQSWFILLVENRNIF